MDALITSQLNVALILKLRGSSMSLAYIIDMLSKEVCTTKHWQMSGRLVQELNDCTVSGYGLLEENSFPLND